MCDSVTASKSKCGTGPFFDSGSCWATLDVTTGFNVYSDPVSCNIRHKEIRGVRTIPVTCDCLIDVYDDSSGTCVHTTPPGCCPSGTNQLFHQNEYTTAELKTKTIAALPSYSGRYTCEDHPPGCSPSGTPCVPFAAGQGCFCTAFANLSSTEISYTARKFKYKFRFTGSASCRLRILRNHTFKPTLTAGITYNTVSYAAGAEDPRPVSWTVAPQTPLVINFSSDPCGPTNPGGAPTNPTGTTLQFDSSVFTVDEPASNGTIYVTDIRWSIINPDDPCDDSDPMIPDCPPPDEYEPIANDPEGIYQFATESPSPYACSGGGSPTCTTVDPAEPNCFPP